MTIQGVFVFSRELFVVSVLFTVDAAAVLLAIHLQAFRLFYSLFPSFPEIPVHEFYPLFFSDGLGRFTDELVVLELAVEKG